MTNTTIVLVVMGIVACLGLAAVIVWMIYLLYKAWGLGKDKRRK